MIRPAKDSFSDVEAGNPALDSLKLFFLDEADEIAQRKELTLATSPAIR
jgi:hypothetical protein